MLWLVRSSLFAPQVTPEQKREGAIAARKREAEAEQQIDFRDTPPSARTPSRSKKRNTRPPSSDSRPANENDESRRMTRPILWQQPAGDKKIKAPSGFGEAVRRQFRAIMSALTRPAPEPKTRHRKTGDTDRGFTAAARAVFRRLRRRPVFHVPDPHWDTFTWLRIWDYHDPACMHLYVDLPATNDTPGTFPRAYEYAIQHGMREPPATHTAYVLKRETRTTGRWLEIGTAYIESDGTTGAHQVYLDRLPVGGFAGHIRLQPVGMTPPAPEPELPPLHPLNRNEPERSV